MEYEESTDEQLISAIMGGEVAAATEFRRRNRSKLEALLCIYLPQADGEARTEAQDIAENLITECCVVGAGSFLRRFGGQCPVGAWLYIVGKRRLINFLRRRGTLQNIVSEQTLSAGLRNGQALPPLLETTEDAGELDLEILIKDAFAQAVKSLKDEHPEQLVFLRAYYLYGVRQKKLAKIWGMNAPAMNRLLADAISYLYSATSNYLKELDPLLETNFEDYQKVFVKYWRSLYGDDEVDVSGEK